jgi:hypothetical protein
MSLTRTLRTIRRRDCILRKTVLLFVMLGIFVSSGCGDLQGASQRTAADQVAALQQSLDARGRAARNFDTSSFDKIFIDEPSVPLTQAQTEALERIAAGTPPLGFLTYMRAYYAYWKTADAQFAQVEAAVRASQKPDPSIVASAVQRRTDPLKVPSLTLRSTTPLAPDKFVIEAEGDGLLYKVTVVQRSGRWFIAGEERSMVP